MNLIEKINKLQSNYYNQVTIFTRPNGDLCIDLYHSNSLDGAAMIVLPLGEQHILLQDNPSDEELLNIINEGG